MYNGRRDTIHQRDQKKDIYGPFPLAKPSSLNRHSFEIESLLTEIQENTELDDPERVYSDMCDILEQVSGGQDEHRLRL